MPQTRWQYLNMFGKGHSRTLLDGRTANLGLHCRVDPSMANDLLIAVP